MINDVATAYVRTENKLPNKQDTSLNREETYVTWQRSYALCMLFMYLCCNLIQTLIMGVFLTLTSYTADCSMSACTLK